MRFLTVLGWMLLVSILPTCPAQAATLSGFLIYAPAKDREDTQPKVTAFSEIFWQSPDGGSITDLSGSSVAFDNTSVAQFVYLDEGYWRSVADNSSYTPYRKGIIDREVVIPGDRPTIASDDAIQPFIAGSKAIASVLKAAPQFDTTLLPIQATLDAEIKHYQDGDRKMNGQWIPAKPGAGSSSTSQTVTAPSHGLDIVTIDGRTYKKVSDVKIDAAADTVSFIYENGGATVDLAMLQPDLQKKFNYDPKEREEQKEAEEKAAADSDAAAQAAVIAQQEKANADVRAFVRSPSKSALNGQVFVATKAGDNIKLGGIHVLLFTKSQMDLVIGPKQREAIKQLTIINSALQKANDDYKKADAASANSSTIIENGVYVSADQRKAELLDLIQKLQAEQQGYLSADYYFSDLPTPLADVQTDADGKFTMSVPNGQYALAAKATRSVLILEEQYWWLVKFDMGEISRSIQLSNENLSSSDSEDSMIVTQ